MAGMGVPGAHTPAQTGKVCCCSFVTVTDALWRLIRVATWLMLLPRMQGQRFSTDH